MNAASSRPAISHSHIFAGIQASLSHSHDGRRWESLVSTSRVTAEGDVVSPASIPVAFFSSRQHVRRQLPLHDEIEFASDMFAFWGSRVLSSTRPSFSAVKRMRFIMPPREILDHGCLTTLLVCINGDDKSANEASAQFLEKWTELYGDGQGGEKGPPKGSSISSPLGNLASFLFPMSPPERLKIVAYLLEAIARAGDGHYDVAELRTAIRETKKSKSPPPTESTKGPPRRLIYDAVNSARKLHGSFMKRSCSVDWPLLGSAKNARAGGGTRLEDYIQEAYLEINQRYFVGLWAALANFAQQDLRLDLRRYPMLMYVVARCVILIHDYYTCDRHFAEFRKSGRKLSMNAIFFVKRLRGLSLQDAKEAIREEIKEAETCVLHLTALIWQDLQKHATQGIVAQGLIALPAMVGGYHYWASTCPQYRVHESEQYEPAPAAREESPSSIPVRDASEDEADTTAFETHSIVAQASPISAEPSPPTSPQRDRAVPYRKPTREAILAPINYIRSLPTKGLCELITTLFNVWVSAPDASAQIIKEAAQHLHDASLILDDMQDNSSIRRGQPAVHTVFGHAQTMQASSYMMVQVCQQCRQLQSPNAIDIFLEELENIHLGQSLDIHWKFELKCPSKEEYLNMVDNKTGAFFRLIVRLLQAETAHRPAEAIDFEPLTTLLGRFYQIRDDYMNLRSTLYADRKGFCEDLDEGKFSYPIIHCLLNSPAHRSHIIGIFRQRPTFVAGSDAQPLSPQAKSHILSCLEESQSFEATLEVVKQLEADIEVEITRLEAVTEAKNPMLRALLETLSLARGTAS